MTELETPELLRDEIVRLRKRLSETHAALLDLAGENDGKGQPPSQLRQCLAACEAGHDIPQLLDVALHMLGEVPGDVWDNGVWANGVCEGMVMASRAMGQIHDALRAMRRLA